MVHIELEDREAELLKRVLEEYVSDLRMQVADTDSKDFREGLKETERVLKLVISRLGQVSS